MGPVHGAKGVGYVDLCQGSQLLGKFRIVLLFFLMKAQVLQQKDLAILQGHGLFLGLLADAVGCKVDLHAGEQLAQPGRHRLKGKLRLNRSLGPA